MVCKFFVLLLFFLFLFLLMYILGSFLSNGCVFQDCVGHHHKEEYINRKCVPLSSCLIIFLGSGEFYKVQLPSSLPAGAQLKAKVEMTFSHVLKPFPSHITQTERQLVVFQGNHYFYSPYPTRSLTTRVRLASKTVESYTKLGNPSKNDEVIEYGPFRDVAPFSEVKPIRHYTVFG